MRTLLLSLVILVSGCRTVPEISPLAAHIDAALSRMAPFGLSGSVLVADRRGVILNRGYGAGLGPDTIYDMGSITKTFTATALLILEEEGKLSTADTLALHFPSAPSDKGGITLDQILSHSGGLPDLIGGDYDQVLRDEFIVRFLGTPLVAKPGTEYHYSNGGYSLLAAIIENVSGMPYETFLRRRLFEPAGMRDTTYRVPRRDYPRVAHTMTPPVDHGSPAERLERAGGAHWVLMGNGGMLTTTNDLYRWELALREGKILSAEVREKLMRPIFRRNATTSLAAAWTIATVDGERVMHHGSDAPELGVNGEFRRYPDHYFTVIFLGNTRVNGWSPRRVVGPQVRKLARGGELKTPRTERADDAARFAGKYVLPDSSTVEIRATGGHLVAGLTGQSAIDLFTVQRSEQSLAARQRLNEKALEVAEARNLTGVEVLGTSRRDRGVFMTTIRAHAGGAVKTLRFVWAGTEPEPDSDDGALPRIGPFSESPIAFALERPLWREKGDSFVFYDIYADETIRVSFAGGRLRVAGVEFLRR